MFPVRNRLLQISLADRALRPDLGNGKEFHPFFQSGTPSRCLVTRTTSETPFWDDFTNLLEGGPSEGRDFLQEFWNLTIILQTSFELWRIPVIRRTMSNCIPCLPIASIVYWTNPAFVSSSNTGSSLVYRDITGAKRNEVLNSSNTTTQSTGPKTLALAVLPPTYWITWRFE